MTTPTVPASQQEEVVVRRVSARRTAWIVAAAAFAVYAGFIALNYFAGQG